MKNKEEKKSISITLDKTVSDALNDLCERKLLRKSAIINRLLKTYLENNFDINFNIKC
jgi:metal-responsive CopG/Arc/MetJ family transcriptional regulator